MQMYWIEKNKKMMFQQKLFICDNNSTNKKLKDSNSV